MTLFQQDIRAAGAGTLRYPAPVTPTTARAGVSRAGGHHGEILQGVFVNGRKLRRGLVTLPCELMRVTATFTPSRSGGVAVRPAWCRKAAVAAQLTLAELGQPATGGTLTISSNITPSRGFGSSTADVTASIGAVLDATDRSLPHAVIASLAVAAEKASDSLMYGDRAVLFAHREGSLIEDLGACLMPIHVLGFGTSGDGHGVDTLAMPPARYTSWEIEAFRTLLGALRRAIRLRDADLLGRVATASAKLNQLHLPIPRFADILTVARNSRAVGVQVAHSGDVAGLLFAPTPSLSFCTDRAIRLLARLGIRETWQFRAGR
jgi:uncharacterized protein involved in propanediol utilization